MAVVDLTYVLAESGSILTGRSALGYRGIVSLDPRVVMEILNIDEVIYSDPRLLIPNKNHETEFIDGVEIASLNQSIHDAFLYDYDNTYVEEMLENLSDKEVKEFLEWLDNKPDRDTLQDKFEFYGVKHGS